MLLADSNFFKFFSFKVIEGDVNSFLKGPNKAVITSSVATRYFGKENPIGKIMLRGSDKIATEVTGVVEDAPAHSHIPFDIVLSGESWDYIKNPQWTSNNLYTYIRFRENSDLSKITAEVNTMAEKHIGPELESFLGMTFKEFKAKGNDAGIFLIPMLDIHLKVYTRRRNSSRRQYSISIHLWRHCSVHYSDCVHQLHELVHCTFSEPRQGSWYPENDRCIP